MTLSTLLKYLRRISQCLLLLFLLYLVGMPIFEYCWRPMFHSDFGFHKDSLSPYYIRTSYALDEFGTIAYFDLYLNLIIAIKNQEEALLRGYTPFSVQVEYRVGETFLIERTNNQLIIVDGETGGTERRSLGEDEARNFINLWEHAAGKKLLEELHALPD